MKEGVVGLIYDWMDGWMDGWMNWIDEMKRID